MDLKEAIESSKAALATSECEWHAYPYPRAAPPHHIRWRKSIEEMEKALEDGSTLEQWLAKGK